MATGAIVTAVVMWVVFIGGLSWCFARWKRAGGKWED